MVIKVFAADALAVGVRVISPAKNASVRNIVREKIAEPVDIVHGCPRMSRCPFSPWTATMLAVVKTTIAGDGG
jgi:hypothetical protein